VEQQQTPVTTASSGGIRIDDRGIEFPARMTGSISLFIDSQRVWSFTPEDVVEARDGSRQIDWPASLKPYLNGEAEFVIRRISDDEVVFSDLVTLGNGEGRIAVVDKHGVPMAIEKLGLLRRMWGESDDERKGVIVDAMKGLLDDLVANDVDAFLAFGCLLGAVREGELIAHDNDADIAYVAKSSHPADVIRESFEIERMLIEKGYNTIRNSGGFFRVNVAMPEGGQVGCDVFTGFFFGDTFYLLPSVGEQMSRSDLLPQGTIELEGRTLPAPAKPEVLLKATYGDGWKVPDPSFRFNPPARVRRRLGGWFRGERKHKKYWDEFYKAKADTVNTEPSPFARWVAEQEPQGGRLLDIGSGTGRDSLWLASQGFQTLGCDYSAPGVHVSSDIAKQRGVDASFQVLNLYDLRQILTSGARFAHEQPFDFFYARFLIHAIEDEGRHNLWTLARSAIAGTGGKLYLEWRTEKTVHEFGEHYRQFVQPEVVRAELEERGFVIDHIENKHGLAVHKSEDPKICRIVARMGDK
jgi:2-polyprenyl-3-methyl-5-hydroxy-6-metoxy-1,4-benzoquinol methylase